MSKLVQMVCISRANILVSCHSGEIRVFEEDFYLSRQEITCLSILFVMDSMFQK